MTILLGDPCATDRSLISLDEARRRALGYVIPIADTERVGLGDALGRILAETIVAALALPPFDQSAMDGYAFAAGAATVTACLALASRIPAGARAEPLQAGKAARVFTGAPIPPGADTVVMQEHVRREGETLLVDGPVRPGSNIRRRGEDIEEGETLFGAGQRLDARHLALLAAQGITDVPVVPRARIAIISTGNELRQPGQARDGAAIFDTNRPMLLALARQAGLDARDGGWVPDHPEALAQRLLQIAVDVDLLVTTGGASVGEEDHSAAALRACGAEYEVLKIALKPGKPAVVGRVGRAAYLGLPGNPVSALVSWLTVGGAMIAELGGTKVVRFPGYAIPIISDFERRPGRTEFVPARLAATPGGQRLEILGRGGSARLKPLALADGLAEIASEAGSLQPGDAVLFHPFQNGFIA